ncbi:MAG: EF-P 5-aminopentanol modification-associated protein YfmH [Anaeroplasmataceae bacterium]
MKKEFDRLINDFESQELNNGLKINLFNKKTFKKKYVMLTINYGSMDKDYYDDTQLIKHPSGVAHFLEHKMFSMPNGEDISNLFSKIGASVNAYTTYDRTCYLFSTSGDIKEALNYLLEFVFTPYFNKDQIETEKKIIESEIKMYADMPDQVLISKLIRNLYNDTTLQHDVLGTVDDINLINEDVLRQAYNAFYKPDNASLIVVADEDISFVKDIVQSFFVNKKFDSFKAISRNNISNIKPIYDTQMIQLDNLTIEKFSIGLTINCLNNDSELNKKNSIILEFILYSLFSKSSHNYEKLIEKKYITDQNYYEVVLSKDFCFALFSAESVRPEKAVRRIIDLLEKYNTGYFNDDSLEVFKNMYIGSFLKMFNSFESIAFNYTSDMICNVDFFKSIEIVKKLTLNDIINFCSSFDLTKLSSVVITKKE